MSATTRKALIVASIALLNAQFSLLFVEPWTAQIYVPIAQTVLFLGALVFLRTPARRDPAVPVDNDGGPTDETPDTHDPPNPADHPSVLADPTPLSQKDFRPYLSNPTPDVDFGVLPRFDGDDSLELDDTPPVSEEVAESQVSTDHLDEVVQALEAHDPEETFTEEALYANDAERSESSSNSFAVTTTKETT